MNPDGSHSTTLDQLAATLTNYFKTIFTTSFNPLNTAPPNHLPTPHSPDNSPSNNPSTEGLQGSNTQTEEGDDALHNNAMFRYTYSIPDLKEIHDIITKMRNNAAPGPDGLNAAFYPSTNQPGLGLSMIFIKWSQIFTLMLFRLLILIKLLYPSSQRKMIQPFLRTIDLYRLMQCYIQDYC
jgi:hypothetical protein